MSQAHKIATRLRRAGARLRHRGSQSGAGGDSLEAVIIVPVILALFMVMVAAGRYQLGTGKIDQAAAAGARAASIEYTASAAQPAAVKAAQNSLDTAGVTCQDFSVTVDTGGYSTQPLPGAQASVSVTVTCTVDWSDLTIPGWPGSKTITSTADSALDIRRIGS